MYELFVGFDGGGTRTRVFLFDNAGEHFLVEEVGASNPAQCDKQVVQTRFNEAIDLLTVSWEKKFSCPLNRSNIVSYYISSAGFSDEEGCQRMRELCKIHGLEHACYDVGMEMYVMLVGALEGKPGISIIAGTGSACFAEDENGRTWQTGGWENLVADEGGGYYLGLQGIIAAVKMSDGRLNETELKSRIFAELGISDVKAIIGRLHYPLISKSEVATLAPVVLRLAEQNDSAALNIVKRGAEELALMAEASHRILPTGDNPLIAVGGGLMRSEFYRKQVFDTIKTKLPESRVILPSLPPVVGAGLLAYKLSGRKMNQDLLDKIRNEFKNKII